MNYLIYSSLSYFLLSWGKLTSYYLTDIHPKLGWKFDEPSFIGLARKQYINYVRL